MSTVTASKTISLQRAETQPRNLIILHETLFSIDILHFFHVYRHAHDKSDGCKYDLKKKWNSKAIRVKPYFHFNTTHMGKELETARLLRLKHG